MRNWHDLLENGLGEEANFCEASRQATADCRADLQERRPHGGGTGSGVQGLPASDD